VVLQQCPVGPSLVSDAAGTHRGRRALQKCFPHTAIKKYNAYVCISAETQTLAQGRGVQGCHTHTPTDVLDRYQVAARLVAQEYLDHENTHTHTHTGTGRGSAAVSFRVEGLGLRVWGLRLTDQA
jgi:hypothetical protein